MSLLLLEKLVNNIWEDMQNKMIGQSWNDWPQLITTIHHTLMILASGFKYWIMSIMNENNSKLSTNFMSIPFYVYFSRHVSKIFFTATSKLGSGSTIFVAAFVLILHDIIVFSIYQLKLHYPSLSLWTESFESNKFFMLLNF